MTKVVNNRKVDKALKKNENLNEEVVCDPAVDIQVEEQVVNETQKDTITEECEVIENEDVVSELEKKLAEKEAIAKDYLDKLQRTMAEYDNFRKRTSKEKSQMYENGAKEVAEKFLPIIDNFERALGSVSDEEKGNAFVQGIEMIYKLLLNTMKDLGVEEIDALYKPFDPNLHHAVSHEENDNYGENEVIEVLQKGYMFKDRVLRFSMVRVAN